MLALLQRTLGRRAWHRSSCPAGHRAKRWNQENAQDRGYGTPRWFKTLINRTLRCCGLSLIVRWLANLPYLGRSAKLKLEWSDGMQAVFVSGCATIKVVPPPFASRLDVLLSAGLEVLVGDAAGDDKLVQQFLHDRGATNVSVFCVGWHPRNNLGRWPAQVVHSAARKGTTQYFAATDVAMAASADLGLMFWDAKSTSTLSKVLELARQKKTCVVFVEPTSKFAVVKDVVSLRILADSMTPLARQKAEDKIALSATIGSIECS